MEAKRDRQSKARFKPFTYLEGWRHYFRSEKRQDILVETFKKMVDKGLKNWKLVLAGGSLVGEDENEVLKDLKIK